MIHSIYAHNSRSTTSCRALWCAANLVLQLDWEVDVLLQAGCAVESSSCLLLHGIGTL